LSENDTHISSDSRGWNTEIRIRFVFEGMADRSLIIVGPRQQCCPDLRPMLMLPAKG
jgi:hypothetical protein